MGRGDDVRLPGAPDPDPERELDQELSFHLDSRAAELEREGISPRTARERAEREFGDLAGARRYCRMQDRRRMRRARVLEAVRSVRDELTMAVRALSRRPGRVLAPGLILALAVALNALVFTVVKAVLLAPLPFPDPSRVFVVNEATSGYGQLARASYPVLDAWRHDARTVESVAGYLEVSLPLVTEDQAINIRDIAVTQGFFGLLDHPFLLGRALPTSAHEPGGPADVVLSESLWRSMFAADPAILERSISLNGKPYQVVGIVRDGARFPDDAEAWVSLEGVAPDLRSTAGAKIIVTLAWLRPGVELDTAVRELGGISAGVVGGAKAAAAVSVADEMLGDVRLPLLLLEGAVFLVLLAACANAGGMLLARGVRRRPELAVRTSLGAGSRRVAGSLLLEGALLGGGAGVLGMLVAAAALKPALRIVPPGVPRAGDIHLDASVVLFAVGLSVVTGLLTALAPAISGSRTSPSALLREATPGGGSSRWLHRVLEGFVVTQVALAVVLTVGAGLLLRSFVATVREDPGFDPRGVTVANLDLPESRYPDEASRLSLVRDLLQRAADLPGEQAVAVGRNLPISSSSMTSPLMVEGASEQTGGVQVALVSSGYFDALRIPVREGRIFSDEADAPATLLVDPGIRTGDGVGVEVGSRAHSLFGQDGFREVVGVVGAVRHDGLRAPPPPAVYEPFFQKGGAPSFSLLVRSDAPAAVVARGVRSLLHEIDPQLPADGVETMSSMVSESLARPRFYTAVLSLFGALAVLLALVGCQAGLAHRVAARKREIGLRMALGASASSVRVSTIGRGLALTAAGAALGLAAALPAARLLKSQLYQVTPGDPVTYLGLLVLLLAAGALASWIPARRASAMDPAEVLREE